MFNIEQTEGISHETALTIRATTDTLPAGQAGLRGVPALIAGAGPSAHRRFLEFFTANIRNRNTRASYARAVGDFFFWCERGGLVELSRIEPTHVGAYIEQLQHTPMPRPP